MRILLATMQYGRGYGQGTERYVSILAGGLPERGHDVTILAGDPERRDRKRALGEVVQDEPRMLAYPIADSPEGGAGWMAVQGLAPVALEPLLAEVQPDIVHIANPAHIGLGLAAAARERRIPVVVTIMDYWWRCPKQTLLRTGPGAQAPRDCGRVCTGDVTWRECLACIAAERPRSWRGALARVPGLRRTVLPLAYTQAWRRRGVPNDEIDRWKSRRAWIAHELNQAAAVIFPSRTAERTIGALVNGPATYRIPYGLEPAWFTNRTATVRERPASVPPLGEQTPAVPLLCEQCRIGYAGALAPHKGVHLLLEALQRLGWTRTPVRIAGRGEPAYEARLRKLAAGLNVHFAGRIAPPDMPEFIGAQDVMVVPSLWPENLPLTVLESYACGVPVIASDVGGMAEIVPPGCTFERGSAAALAICLSAWLTRADRGELPRVNTADEMVAATNRVYEAAVRGS